RPLWIQRLQAEGRGIAGRTGSRCNPRAARALSQGAHYPRSQWWLVVEGRRAPLPRFARCTGLRGGSLWRRGRLLGARSDGGVSPCDRIADGDQHDRHRLAGVGPCDSVAVGHNLIGGLSFLVDGWLCSRRAALTHMWAYLV